MKFKERVDFIKKKKKEVGELTSQHLIAQNEPEQKKNEGTEGLSISESSPGTRETRAEELCLNSCQPVINFKPLEFDILVRLTEIDHERGYIDLA